MPKNAQLFQAIWAVTYGKERIPEWQPVLVHRLFVSWQSLFWAFALLLAVIVLGIVLHRLIFFLVGRMVKGKPHSTFFSVARHIDEPVLFILLVLLLLGASPMLPLPPHAAHILRHIGALCLIACLGWLIIALFHVAEDLTAPATAANIRTTWMIGEF